MDTDNTILWTKELSIGNPDIDNEHARIIQLYNELANSLTTKNDNNRSFAEIMNGMFDYSLYHFRREELYMKLINYPELTTHKEKHKAYILHVSQLNANYFSENPPDPTLVLTYLADWWRHHIQQTDQLYEQFKRKNHPELIVDWLTL